jgi:hypothetical protein
MIVVLDLAPAGAVRAPDDALVGGAGRFQMSSPLSTEVARRLQTARAGRPRSRVLAGRGGDIYLLPSAI